MDPTRAFVKNVKRVVFKVGTAVVTRDDGRLAVGRVGAIFEQLEVLNSQGYEIILVTSGAVGAGRQRLKYRRLLNSSFADLQKPQIEIDGKACAALDVTSSQLLVTDNDFKSPDFRTQLSQTVNVLLALRSIPIFNENDAISTRKAPYEDSTGIFWDNDSLASLLALELKADLLVLLSDVEGLYSGPPSNPNSKLIPTYIKNKHQGVIQFGDKSRVGRGGMHAKVKAAINAAYAGTPVVITSGFDARNISRVLEGQRVGTLFHQDAHSWTTISEFSARDMAVAARECSIRLQSVSSEERRKILSNIADALEDNENVIKVENEADVDAAHEAHYDESLISRLVLKPEKASKNFKFFQISSLAKSIRTIADMEEPIGQILKKTEIAEGLILEKTTCPLGVLLIIFESRPDALVQIASLAIRSGNGLLLKGGKEARRTNAILHKVITEAIPDTVGEKLIGLVTSKEEIPDLLKLDDVIDLVIPRGSNRLVSQIKSSTKIPVLGHSDGICHVYVDKSANMEMARHIIMDSKLDYPAACNAMETLLVHQDLTNSEGFQDLVLELRHGGVTLYGGPQASSVLNILEANSLHQDGHTECIVAEDEEIAEYFLHQVDSAAVFHNASTRFCDGMRFGLGAEVGISTSKIHARGPVGVEGLLTTKWVMRGNGHIVKGDEGVNYTHKNLDLNEE
ncbi:hypothetical protein BUALT_Bualt11G0122400 [Buddleja alternifolia]|uniref:Delta-1-pyrroline-5-carboxylate synthase n=1 Tax=Buddleja alternifolia TaxID=168488 RepID=A0AAV6X5B5_9LAMI|nr:hypothetical protein BUALT_Bualt11G0122400 [Buddleja alternifolia]